MVPTGGDVFETKDSQMGHPAWSQGGDIFSITADKVRTNFENRYFQILKEERDYRKVCAVLVR